MGGSFYNSSDRNVRATASGFSLKSVDEIFTQNKIRQIHESMSPMNLKMRECRDSGVHPTAFPIILGLDLTGSMGHIPHDLIKSGLPALMTKLIDGGAKDAAVCFLGIGDHECDRAPLQVGQFESGDAELDMWLTRTWIEGGGGGNRGESYLLAWLFAAFYTVSDAWDKRKQKGYVITLGDEPSLDTIPINASKEIFGVGQATYTDTDLLGLAEERYKVYHIIINHSARAGASISSWKQKLGDRCIIISHYSQVAEAISHIVLKNNNFSISTEIPVNPIDAAPTEDIAPPNILL